MLTRFGVSVILVIGEGRGEHSAYNGEVSWLVKGGSDVPSELDQTTAFADRDVRSWNGGTPVGKGAKKDYYLKGRPIKSEPRTLLSSQVVPFREFQD